MSKQQTFITKLIDENNKMIDFERWADKRIKTVESKLKELYTRYYGIYKNNIEKSEYIVIYETLNNNDIEVKRINIKEFLSLA
jgi:hypothetical protein